jgi:hypothetical protein
MPTQLSTSYDIDWSTSELGVAAELFKQGNGKSLTDLVKSFGASAAKNGLATASAGTDIDFTDGLSFSQSIAMNNHQEMLFRGMQFRSFDFKFRFVPQSEEENQNAENIVSAFKFYAAPEIIAGTTGRFWIYPAEFDIQFFSNGSENLSLAKISTCVLTKINVDYTPIGSFSAHRKKQDGSGSPPVCVDLSMTFSEVEYVTKQNILRGM